MFIEVPFKDSATWLYEPSHIRQFGWNSFDSFSNNFMFKGNLAVAHREVCFLGRLSFLGKIYSFLYNSSPYILDKWLVFFPKPDVLKVVLVKK